MTFSIRIELPPGMRSIPDREFVIKIDCDGQSAGDVAESGGRASGLSRFMRGIIGTLRQDGRQRTAETYASTLSSFTAFRRGRDTAMETIDAAMAGDYERWMRRRGLSLNTVSFYMRIMRSVYNRAVSAGLTADRKPFRDVYTGIARTRKRALPTAVLRAIRDFPCRGVTAFARDMFMFSFYTRGMSFVDMAHLRRSDISGGTLTYVRRKTGQKIRMRWEPCMEEIVRRYEGRDADGQTVAASWLLPILYDPATGRTHRYKARQWLVNYQLNNIAAALGIEEGLTMYVARHSWASVAKGIDIPLGVISDGMGHHSPRTTQIYLDSIDAGRIDRANAMIIEAVSD